MHAAQAAPQHVPAGPALSAHGGKLPACNLQCLAAAQAASSAGITINNINNPIINVYTPTSRPIGNNDVSSAAVPPSSGQSGVRSWATLCARVQHKLAGEFVGLLCGAAGMPAQAHALARDSGDRKAAPCSLLRAAR